MQIQINGSHYGEWGIRRYGAQSRKVGTSCLHCNQQLSMLCHTILEAHSRHRSSSCAVSHG